MYFCRTPPLLLSEQDNGKLLVINGAWWAKKLSETFVVTDFDDDEDNFKFAIIKLSEREEKVIKGKDYNEAIRLLLKKSNLDNEV